MSLSASFVVFFAEQSNKYKQTKINWNKQFTFLNRLYSVFKAVFSASLQGGMHLFQTMFFYFFFFFALEGEVNTPATTSVPPQGKMYIDYALTNPFVTKRHFASIQQLCKGFCKYTYCDKHSYTHTHSYPFHMCTRPLVQLTFCWFSPFTLFSWIELECSLSYTQNLLRDIEYTYFRIGEASSNFSKPKAEFSMIWIPFSSVKILSNFSNPAFLIHPKCSIASSCWV